jgi:hypothetical protein
VAASQANGLVNRSPQVHEPLPSYECLLPFYSFVFVVSAPFQHCSVQRAEATAAAASSHTATTTGRKQVSLRFKFEHLGGLGVFQISGMSHSFSAMFLGANGNLYRDRHTGEAHVLKNASSGATPRPPTAAGALWWAQGSGGGGCS